LEFLKEREMPARKTVAKSAKAKKPAAAKSAAKKPVVASRKKAVKAAPAAAKRAAPPKPKPAAKPAARPVAKVQHKKPSVTESPKSTPSKPKTKKPAAAADTTPAVKKTTQPAPAAGAEGSLLAGPRNVQPYVAKSGEQYMNREQLDHFRQILSHWKRDLMVEVDRTVSHMKDEAANFPDPNDRATQEEEFSLELRTRDRERKLIRKIEEALERIEDGSYGYCLETGEPIGVKRLEARPVATLSLEAQERRERRERQYGDRDDRYR
jgi:DnaK suppressor protein